MEKRIKQVREKLKKKELDGIIVEKKVNREYLTGFTGSAGLVFITGDDTYLIVDFRYTEQAKQQAPAYQVVEHGTPRWDTLKEVISRTGAEKVGFEAKHVSFHYHREMEENLDFLKLIPQEDFIEELREIKDREEVEIMRQAAAIADRAFNHILTYIEPGVTEREVALELEFFMRREGASGEAFETIVASGKRASLPHGVASEKKIENGDFVTMDFGCVYKGYCSDLTRTVVVGRASEKQREIYDLVLEAQLKAVNNIKAGMTGKEADALARDLIAARGYKENFGHGLGHGLGKEVHEAPRVSFTNDQPLHPGMVVTVEPGIYVPDWGGVRIEDDVVITEDGCEILTASPKELIELG